ncbi:LLM-partnered FMN reductase [Streptomyces albogriseolus]|uniref:LLM-partnered FMN reductase n=1 Tax=Streptomyces albogriseolus TaxID=1887 RepID=A0ACC6UQ27_STRAO
MRLVVVSAGLSVPSSTRLLGDRLASAAAASAGADPAGVRVVELRDLAVQIAHTFTNGFPGPALSEAFDAVTGADGLIVVTPVFSASYSGLFKSFFDALSSTDPEALTGTPVLIAATGGSARHSLVLDHALRPLFSYLRAVVVPTGVYAASEDWGAEGLNARIGRAAGELAALAAGAGADPALRQAPTSVRGPGPDGRPSPGPTAVAVPGGPGSAEGGLAGSGPGRDGHPSPGVAAVPGGRGSAEGGPAGSGPGRDGRLSPGVAAVPGGRGSVQGGLAGGGLGRDGRPSPGAVAVPGGRGSVQGGVAGSGPGRDGRLSPGAAAVPGGPGPAQGGPLGRGPNAPSGGEPSPATGTSADGAEPPMAASGAQGTAPRDGAAPGGRASSPGSRAGSGTAAPNGQPSPGPGAAPGRGTAPQPGAADRRGAPVGAPLPKKDTFENVTPFAERLAALRPGG